MLACLQSAMNQSEHIHALHKCKQQPYVIMKKRLQEGRVWGHKLCQNILADVVTMARLGYHSEEKVPSSVYQLFSNIVVK